MIQTDSELSETLMRAFILRRVELIAQKRRRRGRDRLGPLRGHAAGQGVPQPQRPSLHLRRPRQDPGSQDMIDRLGVGVDDVPVVVCRGSGAQEPDQSQIAECLGFNESIDQTHVRDLVVVGAGPSGLAAAVYGSSEGLDVWCSSRARRADRRLQLEDRELPGFSHRDQWRGPGWPRLHASAEVRRPGHHRQEGEEARLRAQRPTRSSSTTARASRRAA